MCLCHREQSLDYREDGELSWCTSWSNSLWQVLSCGLVYFLGGNTTEFIWRFVVSSLGIFSWTPLKPKHSNPNPNPLANNSCVRLPYSSHTSHHPSETRCLPWIPYATQKQMLDSCIMVQKQSEAFHTFLWHFSCSLKQNFIAFRSSKVSDCIFEIHHLWQLGFSIVYSNFCCSCSFEPEIMKINQSPYMINSNNLPDFQESTTILNAHTKNVWKLIACTSY